MKLATWNVNSLNVRLAHLLDWLEREAPDVVGLQETKLTDDRFPTDALAAAGYHAAFAGQKTYNGVAVLSRRDTMPAPAQVLTDLPGFDDEQRRFLGVTLGELRFLCLYVPNGSEVGSHKYAYKLAWMAACRAHLEQQLGQGPNLAVVGDFNVAPADADVHDPEAWAGAILCSDAERQAFTGLLDLGLHDAFRLFEQPPETFSWWDYRMGAFRRNRGLRIDHILVSDALRGRCAGCRIDREPRTWKRPSDHAPVVARFSV